MTARSRSKSPEDEPISFTIGGGVVRGGELPSANKLEGLTPHDKQASKLSVSLCQLVCSFELAKIVFCII